MIHLPEVDVLIAKGLLNGLKFLIFKFRFSFKIKRFFDIICGYIFE
jgi:hypothetical protein